MFKRLAFFLFSKFFDHKGEYTMSEAAKDQKPDETPVVPSVEEQPTPVADDTADAPLASPNLAFAPSDAVGSRPEVPEVNEEEAVTETPVPVVEPVAVPVEEPAPTPVVVPETAPVAEPTPAPAVTPSTDSTKTEGDATRFDHLASTLKSLLQVAGHEIDEAFDDAVPLAKQIASSDEDFGDKLKDILVVVGREYGEAFHNFFSYAKKHI
ncbi:hypothetical protein AH06_118 [Erwinia phage AH06]|nr:hypothetical protein AH06_118 [Erwinia phage AH06]